MFRSLVLIVGLFAGAYAFGSGAPVEVCQDLTPQHPADPQTGLSPYSVSADKNQIKPGDRVKVTLEGLNGEKFKGFIVQARVGEDIVGSFNIDPTETEVQSLDCSSGSKNAVTHTNPKDKSKITVTWVAPSNLHGSVVFKATFVKNGRTFWVAQTSPSLTISH